VFGISSLHAHVHTHTHTGVRVWDQQSAPVASITDIGYHRGTCLGSTICILSEPSSMKMPTSEESWAQRLTRCTTNVCEEGGRRQVVRGAGGLGE
jgi:hypothetical protein